MDLRRGLSTFYQNEAQTFLAQHQICLWNCTSRSIKWDFVQKTQIIQVVLRRRTRKQTHYWPSTQIIHRRTTTTDQNWPKLKFRFIEFLRSESHSFRRFMESVETKRTWFFWCGNFSGGLWGKWRIWQKKFTDPNWN